MFIGKSLTNIRILNDLSRSKLAEKLGVTEQAVWQYENGYVSPKIEIVNKLKEIFHVKGTYFYNEDLLTKYGANYINEANIAYRSETINSVHKTQSEKLYISYLDLLLRNIEGRISYPENILLGLREDSISFMNSNVTQERKETISLIAQKARKLLDLNDSNANLLFALEKAGAFIFEKEMGDTIDAYSIWSEDDRPYIMLGTIKKSYFRRNFDLAHELGHLLLHYKQEFNRLENKEYKELEKEANFFASEFLLPKEEFERDFNKVIKKSNPDAYKEMKLKWGISLQAIAKRAFSLELIDYQQYRYFNMSINTKGYKKIEPFDRETPIKKPSKVRSIIQLLLEKNIIDLEGFLDELNINLKFLSGLTGIDEGFFKKYLSKENKYFSIDELKIKY